MRDGGQGWMGFTTFGGGLRLGQLAAQHVGSCRATWAEGTFAPGGDAETAAEVNVKPFTK